MQGEVSLSCPGLTVIRDTPQLQEAIAASDRLRCGHILILLQMEGYLVLTVVNDKYKRVHREERKTEEEVG